jgi:AraC-like DNA-binding protein
MIGRRARAAQRGFVVEQISRGKGTPETVHGTPGQRLMGHVHNYRGYRNERDGWARLRLVPSTRVKLDISFGALPRMGDSNTVPTGAAYGMRTHSAALARFDGPGIQVELTPHGAFALLGVPLWEVTDTVIDMADVLGRRAEQIVAQLAETPGWRARLALLDDVLTASAEAGPTPAPQVVWAWQRLCRSTCRIPIALLAAEVGWTRRHLLTRFREQIGLSPKTAARVIRFQHALQLLQQPGRRPSVASVAQATGYSDQAHLTREFRALAGATPVELGATWPRHEGDAASI